MLRSSPPKLLKFGINGSRCLDEQLATEREGIKERAQNNFPICLASGGRIAALPLVCVARHTALGCALHCIPPDASKSGNYFAHVPKLVFDAQAFKFEGGVNRHEDMVALGSHGSCWRLRQVGVGLQPKQVVKNILTSCLSILPVAGGRLRLRADSQFPRHSRAGGNP